MVANGDVTGSGTARTRPLLRRFGVHSVRSTWQWRGGTSRRQLAQRLRPSASKVFYVTAALHGQPRAGTAKLPGLALPLTFSIFSRWRRSERRPIITILLVFFALTSSVTLNLFSKATNFCLKLGCCNRKDTHVHFFNTQVRKKEGCEKGRGESCRD